MHTSPWHPALDHHPRPNQEAMPSLACTLSRPAALGCGVASRVSPRLQRPTLPRRPLAVASAASDFDDFDDPHRYTDAPRLHQEIHPSPE